RGVGRCVVVDCDGGAVRGETLGNDCPEVAGGARDQGGLGLEEAVVRDALGHQPSSSRGRTLAAASRSISSARSAGVGKSTTVSAPAPRGGRVFSGASSRVPAATRASAPPPPLPPSPAPPPSS